MTNTSTKRALFSSVVSLFLCFVMLMGTTFAWFTDIAVSEGNVIQAGTLDVQLLNYVGDQYVDISENSDPIFGKIDSENANADTADTLWEPGKTQTAYLCIKNNGSLDLKYKVAIEVTNISKNLHEVLEYIITPDAKGDAKITKADLDWEASDNRVVPGINIVSDTDTALQAGGEHYFALSVHMDEEAGNEYQEGNVTFNIKILAGQLSSEEDSFDAEYDIEAEYPNEGSYVEIPDDTTDYEERGFDLEYYVGSDKVGTANVPLTAIADDAKMISLTADPSDYTDANIVINTGYDSLAYDVTVSGIKENNNTPITVQLRIPTGLDSRTVTAYHYGEEISVNYSAESGLAKVQLTSFSPVTIVFDPNSVAPAFDPTTVPVAKVTKAPQFENVDLDWGKFGGWSPDASIDANPQLEAVYTFAAEHSAEEAKASNFADWYCDFYVKLESTDGSNPFVDEEGSNYLFLGGNYGSFGWIGFHFTADDYESGYEIGLMESVTSNPWTYAEIVDFVGTFHCGVGDADDSLAGCTFTVTLRLTDNTDPNTTVDVETIVYTFPAN